MKQKFFTLIMMLALVIVTGSAFAASGDPDEPYRGGTYAYSLTGIDLSAAADYAITYTGADVTFSPSTGSFASGNGQTLNFNGIYGAAATSGSIVVTITYQGANGCSNSRSLPVVPVARPTFALGVTSPATACQNYPDGTSTVVTYTVTPTTSAIGYTYTYTLAFTPANINGSAYTLAATGGVQTGSSITVTNAAAGASTVTVTFNSAAGAAVSLVGDLAATPVMTLAPAEGGGTVNGGANSPDTATTAIGAMPVLGTLGF